MRISDWSSDVCSSDLGPYALQAALAACHARARRAEETDWRRIAALYDRLGQVMPSPVVELTRAVAHSMAFGPEAGLALIDTIAGAAALRNYAPMPTDRGGSLPRPVRPSDATQSFDAAAALSGPDGEHHFIFA